MSKEFHEPHKRNVEFYAVYRRMNVKKIIFSSTLVLSGVVGFVGVLNACVNKNQPGAYSEVISHVRGSDWLLILVSLLFIIVGLITSYLELKIETKQ